MDEVREDQRELLARLRQELEELEEEQAFTLSQTGLHVTGGARKRFEAEIAALKARIKEVEDALAGA